MCILEEALLPAELALVEIGEQMRVQETRSFFQMATRKTFIETVEQLTGREVTAFASASDPPAATVWEIYNFAPR